MSKANANVSALPTLQPAPQTWLAILFLCSLAGCATKPAEQSLNSDRIRAQFGNYGVEVLYADDSNRISSLYSETGRAKTTRTFAIVQFQGPMPVSIAREHREILAGGSIGSVFRDNGWSIRKHHIHIGEVDPGASRQYIFSLMRIAEASTLATHVYMFNVSNGNKNYDYATIVEIHHPDYLDTEQLIAIYGELENDDSKRTVLGDFVALPEGSIPES